MVLKNSKWDRKAKKKYLKKHGLFTLAPTDNEQRPKWSSKRADAKTLQVVLEDTDSEWDSDQDEEFLNQYYPEIGKQDLTRDQKEKIRQQILQDLLEEQENDNAHEEEDEFDAEKSEGIYLGSKENMIKEKNGEEEKVKLHAYISKDPLAGNVKKNRKLPKNRMQDNLLEEYGLDSYSETVTKDIDDYNLPYYSQKDHRNIDKISSSELDGFKIGESTLGRSKAPQRDRHIVRDLTEEEIKENAERAAKSDRNKFYNQMKNRFNNSESDPKNRQKVIEVNNFNENDEKQMQNLNAKLANLEQPLTEVTNNELDDDIDLLLGDSKPKINLPDNSDRNHAHNVSNIDDFLSSLDISGKNDTLSQNYGTNETKEAQHISNETRQFKKLPDQDFLDDLLS